MADDSEDIDDLVQETIDRLQDVDPEGGVDALIGECPDCGLEEYYLHIFINGDRMRTETNCLWCGYRS